MITYDNYYGINEKDDKARYDAVVDVKFDDIARCIAGLPTYGSLDGADYAAGAEVARAEITPWSLSNSYLRLSTKRNVYEIWFFEVREVYRDLGIGRRFAEMLTDSYAPTEVTAFSEGGLMTSGLQLGGKGSRVKMGDPHYRPLFVNKVW